MSERYTWLAIGVGAALALHITNRQLFKFKKRCAIQPSKTKNVGVEQATEDALKLETLAALARGVNPELRAAALKIIAERALRGSSVKYVLDQIEGPDQAQRIRALKALNLAVGHGKPADAPRLVQVLARCLKDGGVAEREAITILIRCIGYEKTQRLMREAGILDLLTAHPQMPRRNNDSTSRYLDELFSAIDEAAITDRLGDMVRGDGHGRRDLEEEWVAVEVDANTMEQAERRLQESRAAGVDAGLNAVERLGGLAGLDWRSDV